MLGVFVRGDPGRGRVRIENHDSQLKRLVELDIDHVLLEMNMKHTSDQRCSLSRELIGRRRRQQRQQHPKKTENTYTEDRAGQLGNGNAGRRRYLLMPTGMVELGGSGGINGSVSVDGNNIASEGSVGKGGEGNDSNGRYHSDEVSWV